MTSDSHLAARYRRHGDADAFCALVQDHAGMVFATAKRITRDAALAEDVAQETFLELARRGHQVVESAGAWLHRVAWRKACNVVRNEVRRRHHEKEAAEALPTGAEPSWKEVEPLIDEVLEELPAPLRETLVGHFLEGRTQQELALHLKISQSTVSRQIDAGLQEVRARLRSRGVTCGAGMAFLLGHGTAHTAPPSLHASLGKIAICGLGSSSGTPVIATAFLSMNITKIALIIAAAGALTAPALLFLGSSDTLSDKSNPAPRTRAPSSLAAPLAKAKAQTAATVRPELPPVPESVRLKVDAILRRHQGMSKAEMLRTDEMQQIIDSFFKKADSGGPEMQRKAELSRKALYSAKGQSPGTGAFVFHTGEPDSPEFREWLEAAVSDDPRRAQDWLLRRLEDAAFEFTFDPSLEQSSGGVSVRRPPAASGAEK